ncbi:hypothetical protein CLV62_12619 [Dysgonomonas alginatilytica]|uniref:OmpA family protein n=1 Tax=Dysgonomonas alginatilytica TaxID=1605892 RepID=A0A2V3PLS0_9BACT|nr:hypothetical protein [Dysgonomonas alginatilytica]PXV61085.1 hypothetical protein CLV62_12619 [Dysgonomonas alginatilytica]
MKKILFYILCAVLLYSCGVKRVDGDTRANISLPVQPETPKQQKAAKQTVIEMKDHLGNVTTYVQTERDKKGKQQLSVQLNEVTVTAKLKSVPERFGKVDIDFIVSVPEVLIDKYWQLNLTPLLIKKDEHIPFDDLVITGVEFDKERMKGYTKYAKYLSGIVPDSLFNDRFVNMRKYYKYLSDYEKSELRRVNKDSMDYVKYKRYIDRLNTRYEIFNRKMYNSRAWLAKQLGFEDIKERYEVFHRDTTYVSRFYNKRYEQLVNLIPQFHLLREVTDSTIISKYRKEKYRYEFVNSYRFLTSADSTVLLTKFYRNKQIERNDKLIAEKELMFAKLVKFPKNLNARLDTVIFNKGKFEYYYHQEIATDEDTKRMRLYMDGTAQTIRGESYLLPTSDTLIYSVSSMIQFLDMSPRYMRKIIERKASSSLKAYITFKVGKSDLDLNLDNNRIEIDKVQEMVEALTETGEFVMDSISLVASSSPEGSYRSNLLLSKSRAESIKKFLLTSLSDIEGIDKMLFARPKGEDWESLSHLIRDSTDILNQQAILDIIGDNTDPDKKEIEIRNRYPEDYNQIRNELYPKLRAVDFTFHIHRKGMIKDTIHTTEPDLMYADAIQLMEKRKYSLALQILSDYNDWNTGICLMSLGYDQGAYTIFLNEKESADCEYLLAILASRLGKEDEAVKRFLHACELDATKRWRGALDPEINKLIKAYGLHQEDEDVE